VLPVSKGQCHDRSSVQMIWSSRRSVRSWSAPATVLLGVPWVFIGIGYLATAQEAGATRATLVTNVAFGVVIALLGLVLMWGGLRMGAFPRAGNLVVREMFTSNSLRHMFRGTTYQCDEILGIGVTTAEHHALPLVVLHPTIRLVNGTDVAIRSLGTFRFLRGSQARAWRAAQTLASWVDKPVVTVSETA
jgi:hypothetical protein